MSTPKTSTPTASAPPAPSTTFTAPPKLTAAEYLEKLKVAFKLHEPIAATPARWKAYHFNRAFADKIRLRDRKSEKKGYESPDSDGEEWDVPGDTIYLLRSIRRTLRRLEKQAALSPRSLQNGAKLLWFTGFFEESYNPRDVDALTRLYAPSTPTYVDVHINYHSQMHYYAVTWYVSIGYKIYPYAPAGAPDKPPKDLNVEQLKTDTKQSTYDTDGWRSIMWGTWDTVGNEPKRGFKRIEIAGVDLDYAGIVDLHEALFGPLPPLDADASSTQKRRETLIRTVRVVLAAVGIDYPIATKDDEEDDAPGAWRHDDDKKVGHIEWMLDGNSDRWFPREIRRAVGFQLERDPKEEAEGVKEKQEIIDEPPEEYEDDGEGDYGPPGMGIGIPPGMMPPGMMGGEDGPPGCIVQ